MIMALVSAIYPGTGKITISFALANFAGLAKKPIRIPKSDTNLGRERGTGRPTGAQDMAKHSPVNPPAVPSEI